MRLPKTLDELKDRTLPKCSGIRNRLAATRSHRIAGIVRLPFEDQAVERVVVSVVRDHHRRRAGFAGGRFDTRSFLVHDGH